MDLSSHPLFEKHVCPASGAVSYLLINPSGQPQEVPYFTTPAMSDDERWLFGYQRIGPLEEKQINKGSVTAEAKAPAHLVAVDLERAEYHVSEEEVSYPSGCYDNTRGLFFFTRENSVYSLELGTWKESRWFTLPDSITRRGKRALFGTHLSISADQKRMVLDGRYGTYTFIGFLDLEEVRFELLHEAENVFYNHALYNPVDPHLIYFAHDWWLHPETGEKHESDHRIWLVRDNDPKPPFPLAAPPGWNGPDWHLPTHEWWAADGSAIYTILHEVGIARLDVNTRKNEIAWQGSVCHGQSSPSGKWFVADQKTYLPEPRSVILIERATGREIPVAIDMPRPPDVFNRLYHLDPHPQISPQETVVIYSGTQRGLSDICLAPIPTN